MCPRISIRASVGPSVGQAVMLSLKTWIIASMRGHVGLSVNRSVHLVFMKSSIKIFQQIKLEEVEKILI